MNHEEQWTERERPAKCPVCKDKKWVNYDVPYGHPDFGKEVTCPACWEGVQPQVLTAACGLTVEKLGWTFANTMRRPELAEVYDTALALAGKPRRFLTLQGEPGVGKTRFLACIINEAVAKGFTAVYMTMPDLLDYLRTGYAPNAATTYDARWQPLIDARVLCIDEIDRYSPTPWAEQKVFQLINARYENGQDHLTCFALNAAIDTLPDYLQSRLRDRQCYLFHLAGQDVRQRKR